MPAFNDISGQTFAHWAVMHRDPERRVRVHWVCRCVCGEVKSVSGAHLASGASKSCGCIRPKGVAHPRFKHGMSDSQMHVLWMGMMSRCDNPAYTNHHGKGVTVCDRWRSSFQAFLDDVGPRPSRSYSLDRWPDQNGNYEPGNVRWATARQQARNMSRNLMVECDGRSMPLAEACEIKGINYDAAKWRVKNGYRFDEEIRI